MTSAGRLGCLGEPNFRRFFIAYTTSIVGSAMVPVALTFAVLNEGYRVADVSHVLAAETVPLVAFLMLGGVIADRLPRSITMVSADLARCVSEGILAVLLLTGTAPVWAMIGLAGVLGAGQAFFNPAMTGLMPETVAPDALQQANALRAVAGPARRRRGLGRDPCAARRRQHRRRARLDPHPPAPSPGGRHLRCRGLGPPHLPRGDSGPDRGDRCRSRRRRVRAVDVRNAVGDEPAAADPRRDPLPGQRL